MAVGRDTTLLFTNILMKGRVGYINSDYMVFIYIVNNRNIGRK